MKRETLFLRMIHSLSIAINALEGQTSLMETLVFLQVPDNHLKFAEVEAVPLFMMAVVAEQHPWIRLICNVSRNIMLMIHMG